MTNHGGKPDKSIRLWRMLETLREFGTASTTLLQAMTGDMAPATTISDLRKAGVPVGPAIYKGRTSTGRKIYSYSLINKT